MIFFFKKNKLNVDCFTNRADLHSLLPVSKSTKGFPEWWKNLPKTYHSDIEILPRSTMKACNGFTEYFKNTFYIPFWSDALFHVGPDFNTGLNYSFADGTTTISVHSSAERGTYLNESSYQHIKVQSPWFIECKDDVKFVFNQNTWEFDKPEQTIIPPGIIDFKYQKATNYNMFFKYTGTPYDVFIKAGSPIVTYAALTEREVKIHNHLLDEKEYKSRREKNSATFVFRNRYNTTKDLIDSTKKCPFHK